MNSDEEINRAVDSFVAAYDEASEEAEAGSARRAPGRHRKPRTRPLDSFSFTWKPIGLPRAAVDHSYGGTLTRALRVVDTIEPRDEPSTAEVAQFKEDWRKAFKAGGRALVATPPLPRRTRLKLWWDSLITDIGCWCHQNHMGWVTELLWGRKMLGQ